LLNYRKAASKSVQINKGIIMKKDLLMRVI